MVRALFSLGLALAAASLPLAASAVPIRATDGQPEAVPKGPAGPRRPGVIPAPAATLGPLTEAQTLNQRGRPVPAAGASRNLVEGQRSKVAETAPRSTTREL